jgi:Tfp pilus assembly protein PilF
MNFLSSYFRLMTRQANWFAREAGQLAWSMLLWPFRAAGAVLWFVGQLLIEWWESRRLKVLLWGTPALLAITASVATALTVRSVNGIDRAQKYLLAGRVAMRAESWSTAKLYYERAMELGAREPDAMFDLAIASEQTGDEARKRAVLQRLAPNDHAVYAPAHLWKAIQILSAGPVTKAIGAEAEQQLKYVIQLDPSNENAHCYLGDMYYQAGLFDSAAQHLRFSSRSSIKYRILLARASAAAGDLAYGKQVAEEVFDAAEQIVLQDPRNLQARLEWGEASLLMDRFADAVRILRDGLSLDARPELRQALALVLVHWSDFILKEDADNKPQAFQLLATALETQPSEYLIFDRMIALLRDSDQTAKDAENFLKDNIVGGRSVGMSHLILGTLYLEKNDVVLASNHMKQSFALMPEGAIVANNYAWFLVKQDPPEAELALKIVDAAEGADTLRPEFSDTRGHIYLALGRVQDAIRELERALPGMNGVAETHRALAIAYEKAGIPDLAQKHLAASEEIDAKKVEKKDEQ